MEALRLRLRAAREAAGVSLAVMATRTHYSKALLGLLETGKRSIRPEHVAAYSTALHVPLDALYSQTADPLRTAHEWLVNDTPVSVQSKSGRRIGRSFTDDMEARVIKLRLLDDTVGGNDLLPLVHRELAHAEHSVNSASYSDQIGRRLLTVVGELAQLCGWAASDAGRHEDAQAIYLSGVAAAQSAGDSTLAAQLLSSLSYQTANIGDPRDALLLARSAIRGAREATPVVKALIFERVAWASARAQDEESALRALDAVDESFENGDTAQRPEPHWVYWLNRAEIDIMSGRCFVELGRPLLAAPLLASAIDGYESQHAREVALYQTWLSESYLKNGELDAAQDSLTRAQKFGKEVNSTRLNSRISSVEDMIRKAGY